MTQIPAKFRVSDHVLLRYMARMLAVDVEGFRAKLHDKLLPYSVANGVTLDGMVFKFVHHPHETVVATMWPEGSLREKQRPPRSGDDSAEAKKIKARKRMAK